MIEILITIGYLIAGVLIGYSVFGIAWMYFRIEKRQIERKKERKINETG